jgi:hypothetical protein
MDEFLSELYGTKETISGYGADDVEKTAATEFLVKLAVAEGVDLNELSDEEVGMLLEEVEKTAAADGEPEIEDEAQEKLAEADFLGRAMAHAYVSELAEIEKEAGIGETAGKAYQAVRGALGRAGGAAKRGAEAAGEWTGVSGIRRGLAQRKAGKRVAEYGKSRMEGTPKTVKELAGELAAKKRRAGGEEAKAGLKRLGLRVGLPAAGAAALGGGAYAAGKSKNSFNEDFEALAQERAYEMLADAGYDIEKVAEADVEVRALQMLEQAGYPVQWNG